MAHHERNIYTFFRGQTWIVESGRTRLTCDKPQVCAKISQDRILPGPMHSASERYGRF